MFNLLLFSLYNRLRVVTSGETAHRRIARHKSGLALALSGRTALVLRSQNLHGRKEGIRFDCGDAHCSAKLPCCKLAKVSQGLNAPDAKAWSRKMVRRIWWRKSCVGIYVDSSILSITPPPHTVQRSATQIISGVSSGGIPSKGQLNLAFHQLGNWPLPINQMESGKNNEGGEERKEEVISIAVFFPAKKSDLL